MVSSCLASFRISRLSALVPAGVRRPGNEANESVARLIPIPGSASNQASTVLARPTGLHVVER